MPRIVIDPKEIDHQAGRTGIEIEVKGYKGDMTDANPSQVFIEVYEGQLKVHVWNGTDEDPHTHTIGKVIKGTVMEMGDEYSPEIKEWWKEERKKFL